MTLNGHFALKSVSVEGVAVDRFSMSNRSGDIRDRIRKLSKSVPKFGRFLSPLPRGTSSRKNFVRIHPLAPKL